MPPVLVEFGLRHQLYFCTGGFSIRTPITIFSALPSIAGGLRFSFTQDDYDQLMALYNAIERPERYGSGICDIVETQAAVYFAGDATLEDTVRNIQSRAELYVSEHQ